MAKCLFCRSCAKVLRVDRESESILYLYCPLCRQATTVIDKVQIDDKNLLAELEEIYEKRFGKVIN